MANTISDELNRLIQAKAGIKSALEEKGLTIGDSSTLDEFPGLIQEMQTGGGSDTSTLIDLIEGDLETLVIPEGTRKIKNYAFYQDPSLINVSIPNTVTKIGAYAFSNCQQLINANLPNNLITLGHDSYRGTSITSISIPSSLLYIEDYAFSGTKITEVYIPETVTQLGTYTFSGCKNLVSVTVDNPTITTGMFYGCDNLQNVYLTEKVTSIKGQAFANCSTLEKIVFPSSLNTIEKNVFQNHSMLPLEVVFLGNNLPASINWIGLITANQPLHKLYCKNAAYDIYLENSTVANFNNYGQVYKLADMDYDSSTMTVTVSGRDNVELYVDSSLIDSSIYTFTPGTEDSSHVITVKSVDPSLGVLDEVSQEILIEGEEIDYSTQYFGISALADSSIGINTLKTDGELLYSEDQENWTQWDYANETLDLLTGETLYFKGNNGGHPCVWDKPLFNITGSVNLHGNISSILWGDDYLTNNTIGDGGMAYAFKNSTAIINCKNLIMTPTYNACYEGCFYNCTNLITAPQLPSLSPAQRAYNSMFSNCTSLTTAPELPALTFPANGYNSMFSGCTNLNYIKAMFTNTPNPVGTLNWVKNVSSTGTFVMNADATWDPEEYRGINGIPEGWTVEKVTA